jgi:glycosyltransferase
MKISIITVVFNNRAVIEDALLSVARQKDADIEHIVIDGGSADGTLDIVKKHSDKISKFVSEPDHGIYDAMNKGIMMATGDIIGFLNSDDVLANDSILKHVSQLFENNNIEALYGDLEYVTADLSKVIRSWISGPYDSNAFQKGWVPPHPTFYAKKEVYKKCGVFNLQFKIAADFELMLRFIEKHHISLMYLPVVMVKMRLGGVSNHSLKNIFNANLEKYQAFKTNHLPINLFYFAANFYRKLKQVSFLC